MNYGYAGLAITLPKVIECSCSDITEARVEEDKLAQKMVLSCCDLAEAVYKLGQLCYHKDDEKFIHSRLKNHTQYYDMASAKMLIQKRLAYIMNNVLVAGEDALILAETMYGYLQLMDEGEPDMFALRLARTMYKWSEGE